MGDPPLNPLFQVGLDVRGRHCLVLGGGREAEDKTGRLLDAGARVTVVSTEATEAIRSWSESGHLELCARDYREEDLEGVFLVMSTVRGDPEWAAEVFAAAERRGVLVNTYDDIPHSHFGMNALVTAGPLRVSISTSNASPSLSRRLREDLEALFDGEFIAYLEALGRVREHLKETVPTFAERKQILGELVAEARIDGVFRVPPDWRTRVAELLQGS